MPRDRFTASIDHGAIYAEFQSTSAACASYPSVTNCFGQPRQSVMNWNESRWLWYAGFYGGLLSALSGCHGRWAGALAQR